MWRKKPQECSFFSFLFMCWVFPVLWRKPWSNGQLKIIVILIIYCAMPLQKPRAFLKDSLVASCWNTLKLDSVGIVNCQGNLSDTRSKEQRPARSLMRLHVLHFISPPTCFVLSYLCEIMFRRGFCHLWLRFVMFPLDGLSGRSSEKPRLTLFTWDPASQPGDDRSFLCCDTQPCH